MTPPVDMLHAAEAADHALAEEMDKLVIVKSTIYTSGERDPRAPLPRPDDKGRLYLMDRDGKYLAHFVQGQGPETVAEGIKAHLGTAG